MEAKKRVLVVDDEPKIVETVKLYLERDGFQAAGAADGRQALDRATTYRPDLIVLDLNLPDMDGLEVCRSLRRLSNVPIIMLTGRGDEVDRIVGLEVGADDYVTKPFSPRELVARVKAVLRRQGPPPVGGGSIVRGHLAIDMDRYEATCRGQKLDLTATEFKLLATLARYPGRVYTRMQLLDAVQGDAYEGYERTIDAHVKNLRHKLARHDGETGCRIETVRGVGYKFQAVPDAP
jgi:DNA-binding response OmpR family regulator